jgi:hypothetical protein
MWGFGTLSEAEQPERFVPSRRERFKFGEEGFLVLMYDVREQEA